MARALRLTAGRVPALPLPRLQAGQAPEAARAREQQRFVGWRPQWVQPFGFLAFGLERLGQRERTGPAIRARARRAERRPSIGRRQRVARGSARLRQRRRFTLVHRAPGGRREATIRPRATPFLLYSRPGDGRQGTGYAVDRPNGYYGGGGSYPVYPRIRSMATAIRATTEVRSTRVLRSAWATSTIRAGTTRTTTAVSMAAATAAITEAATRARALIRAPIRAPAAARMAADRRVRCA